MISLIICSRTKHLQPDLAANIEATIGVPYEIIQIDNSDNKYSIFEAYNLGVQQSNSPVLCFMHDDILYHTANWGRVVLKHFEDEKTGAIGIAGTPYAAAMLGSWWGGLLVNQYLLPANSADSPAKVTYKEQAIKNEVVLIDGVWFCARKSLFDNISFDSRTYQGFHFYDVDTSMQIGRLGYRLYTVFDILISHYANSKMDKTWCENAMLFNKKWQKALPRSSYPLSYTRRCEAELETLKEFVYTLLYNGYPKKQAYGLALSRLLRFRRGYLYYKTPLHFAAYSIKYMFGIKHLRN